jgi:hypothetical protein
MGMCLMSSGAVSSSADGQVIENFDIFAAQGNAVTILHKNVTVTNCRIRHAEGHGIHARYADNLLLQNLEVERVEDAPKTGRKRFDNNIDFSDCPNARVVRVRALRGSSNFYAERSPQLHLGLLEAHDARGPFPRGQNIQFNQCPGSLLEDFSAENGPSSWTEDNVSVYRSDGCAVRRGLVSYNNSPTGDGVMLEGSSNCLVEDVDAVQQGNGAFAAVPEGRVGSGGCVFLRCRTRQSYNTRRDGRDAPSSNGVSFYVQISAGARKHTIADCHYDHVANPRNLIWNVKALNPGWSFSRRSFVPRSPLRLAFQWE